MTNEQQETIVNEALRIFCDYLNFWWNKEFPEKPNAYSPEKFTITDFKNDLYGETKWEVFSNEFIKITASDGDEGGPNELYVNCDYDNSILWIVQVFDTYPNMIYTYDRGITHKP
jgi:hypothetical protein